MLFFVCSVNSVVENLWIAAETPHFCFKEEETVKIMTVLGARPQFIKASAVSGLIRKQHSECLVHTGQHFDFNMSELFFRELNIPRPDYDLGISGGTHAEQVGSMVRKLDKVMQEEKPDAVLVYGDTNSTLAGALVASQNKIPVIHVEAGLRSFDRSMPEEVNRILVDCVSTLLFAPTAQAVKNLEQEGFSKKTHLVGDVMYDIFCRFESVVRERKPVIIDQWGLKEKGYSVLTIHRQGNVDKRKNLRNILEGLSQSGEMFVFPVHPRTKNVLSEIIFDNVLKEFGPRLRRIDPLGYIDFMALVSGGKMVVTDSGGLQKEAYMLGVPCLTLRDSTEWVETIKTKWNRLVPVETDQIRMSVKNVKKGKRFSRLYGDANAAEKIVNVITETFCHENTYY